MTDSETRIQTSATIPSLDGIRAIAVALVVFAHSGLENRVPGGLGVTIFFVLSGYLITTLMRVEHTRIGAIDFRNFYLRRLLRLMPPLLIVVAVTAVLARYGILDEEYTAGGLLSTLFYFGNYYVIAHDYSGIPQGIGVVWSLAVEEHFYIFYPFLAAFLLRRTRAARAALVLTLLCAAILAWRYWLAFHGVADEYINMATDTRIDAILIGCVVALWRNPWLDRQSVQPRPHDWLLMIACLAVLAGSLLYRDEFFRNTLRYTLQGVAIAGLLYLSVLRSHQAPFRWLDSRPLIYLGGVSYTVYLSHHVILFALAKHWPQLNAVVVLAVTVLITLGVAELMRRWVEQPAARLRKRLHRERAVSITRPMPWHTAGIP